MNRGSFLIASLLLFLFAGLYKPYVASPVDLTLVACFLTMFGVWLNMRGFPMRVLPIMLGIAFLLMWTALRLTPDFSPFGVAKFAESIAFGLPALAGGFVVARKHAQRFVKWLIRLGVALAVLLFATAEAGFNSIGDSYQLTGIFFALAMIAAVVSRRWLLASVSFAAIVLTGNLSGLLFGVLGASCAMLAAGQLRRLALVSIALSGIILAYGILWGLPAGIDRVLHKMERVWTIDLQQVESAVETGIRPQRYDRPQLYYAGWLRFLEAPLTGHGLGNADYVFDAYPHNVALELAAETGIVGLALFLGVMAMAFAAARRSPLAIGVFVLIGLTSMVSGYWGGRMLFFALGMAAGAYVPRARRVAVPQPALS